MKTYKEFRQDVKNGLAKYMRARELSDKELEDYLKSEEDQIEESYERYKKGYGRGELTEEAHYNSEVHGTVFSLDLCY